MPLILWLVAVYILGSVSFAYLAAKSKGIDLRKVGSGNLGATNAGRVMGGKWFAIIFICDVLKGLIPVLLAKQPFFPLDHIGVAEMTAAAAILGHVFTCFHGFKGGKAVATSLGAVIALASYAALYCFGVWMLVWLTGIWLFKVKKRSAVGPASIVAAAFLPVAVLALTPGDPWAKKQIVTTILLLALAALVLVKHRSNAQKVWASFKAKK
jgi:glycerol-3-phosphate acyltransferase PlsY